ncbi:unnamed protein product [Pieris macdunnoughi]|uniref:Uncharacterized protein n=1 Tax=Pieris macdunnoughi TaxID=345717 RepID=A0A821SFC4_9NEOP|nr:unnamed protein product [Pieris macdunnoughi]
MVIFRTRKENMIQVRIALATLTGGTSYDTKFVQMNWKAVMSQTHTDYNRSGGFTKRQFGKPWLPGNGRLYSIQETTLNPAFLFPTHIPRFVEIYAGQSSKIMAKIPVWVYVTGLSSTVSQTVSFYISRDTTVTRYPTE